MPGYRGSVNIDPAYPAQGVYAYGPQTLVIRPKTESEILAPAMGWIQQMLPYWQEEWRAMRSQGLGRTGGTSGGGSAGGSNAGGGQTQAQTKPRTGVDVVTSTITPGQLPAIGQRAAQLIVPNKPVAVQQPAAQQPAVIQQTAAVPQTPIEQLVALENRITDEVARNIGDVADDNTVNVPTIWDWLSQHGVKFNTTPLINAENLITNTAARSIGDVADDNTVNVPTVWSLLRQFLNPAPNPHIATQVDPTFNFGGDLETVPATPILIDESANRYVADQTVPLYPWSGDMEVIPNAKSTLATLLNSIQLTPPANAMPVGTTTMKPNAPRAQGWGFLPNRPQEPVELPMSYLQELGWVNPNTVVRPTPFSAIR